MKFHWHITRGANRNTGEVWNVSKWNGNAWQLHPLGDDSHPAFIWDLWRRVNRAFGWRKT